jgi:hypothetical protein
VFIDGEHKDEFRFVVSMTEHFPGMIHTLGKPKVTDMGIQTVLVHGSYHRAPVTRTEPVHLTYHLVEILPNNVAVYSVRCPDVVRDWRQCSVCGGKHA